MSGTSSVSEQQPILIIAVLENIGDLSGAEADLERVTITLG